MKKMSLYCFCFGMITAVTLGCTACGKKTDIKKNTVAAESNKKAAKEKEKQPQNIKLSLSETKELPGNLNNASYKSSNQKIAVVSSDGVVHGIERGKATITMKAGNKTVKYNISIAKRGMVYPTFTMLKGEHLDLQFSNKLKAGEMTWSSNNKSIATVSKKGKVVAKKPGSVTISGKGNGKTYSAAIKVKKRPKNIIYLTFDDGPNSYSTPKILNILKKNNVKATFFELRPARPDYKITKRVIKEGHTLALHGFKHKYDQIYKSEKVYKGNLDKLRNLFFKKYGVWCTVSRFPGGSSNTVSRYNPGIMTRLTKKLDGWGYHYFDWNVDSEDAGGAKTPEQTFHNVTSELHKGRGNVVLMHDFYKNDKTINALDKMIKYGKKHGYVFLPITASTDEVHHGVNN